MLLTRLMNAPMRLQKIIAAALMALGFAFACAIVASAFALVRDRQSELTGLREKAGRLEQIVSMKGGVGPAPDEPADAAAQPLFLEAESLTIGRANLQSRMDAIAQSSGLLLSSAGGLPNLRRTG